LLSAVFQVVRGIFLILLAIQASAIPAMLLFWLVYLNMGIINSPMMTLFNNEVPSEHRSSMLSIGSLISYLGSIAGSTALGYVAEKSSIGLAWTISGVGLILAAYFYLKVDSLLKKRSVTDEDEAPILETS
jgi:predicted MFS family arabinose efflux permease